MQATLARVLNRTQASAVVLRLSDGLVLGTIGQEARISPGSTIKPLILSWALQHGVLRADTKVFCRRSLQVGQKQLPCTHPSDQTSFTAQSAIAESCNTYFADLALRLRSSQLEQALRAAHLPHADATDDLPEQRELTVLGLQGVMVTPMQLARAYREFIVREDPHGPVVRGLVDSVNFGMANPARIKGVELLGKTGTAGSSKSKWTHGWFAGAIPGSMVFVIYIPHGNGGDAAGLAGAFFRNVIAEKKR